MQTAFFAEFGAMLTRVAAMYEPPGADREDLAQEMAALAIGQPAELLSRAYGGVQDETCQTVARPGRDRA